MKRLLFLILLFISLLNVTAQVIVENPPFSVAKSHFREVERITLTDTATILDVVAIHNPGWWIMAKEPMFLKVGDKAYPARYVEGIEIGKETFTDDKGEHRFRVITEPIPLDTKQVDYFEGNTSGSCIILGIELQSDRITNRLSPPKEVQEALNIREDNQPLTAPIYKDGKAKLKGQFAPYHPEFGYDVTCYVNDPILGGQQSFGIKVAGDGSFSGELPIGCTQSVLFRIQYGNHILYNDYILLSPDEKTNIYIDLQQKTCQEARFRKDKCEEAAYVLFGGANAEINNQMNRPLVKKFIEHYRDQENELKTIVGMTATEYLNYRLKKQTEAITQIPKLNLTRKAAMFLEQYIIYDNMYHLMFGDSNLEYAYQKANNLPSRNDMPGYEKPVMDKEYYKAFLKDSPINNPISLLSDNFGNMVNSCKYIERVAGGITMPIEGWELLVKEGGLSKEEQDVVAAIIADEPETLKEEKRDLREKYNEEISSIMTKFYMDDRMKPVADIMGTDKGILFELMETQTYGRSFQELTPLNKFQLYFLSEMENPFYYQYLSRKNNELLALIEANKNNIGYNVYPTPEVKDDQLFQEIIKPFQGKVILVDFWETWCGPCRSAMKQFEPAKGKLKEKGVVFLYLASESSPTKTWENMIPTIHGEHFRVTNEQMRYLREQFDVQGVPSYMILNKEGKKTFFNVGFPGISTIERELDKVL